MSETGDTNTTNVYSTLESLGPMEVVVVSRDPDAQDLFRALLALAVFLPFDATLLMLAVPFAHDAVGTPDRHPGWWACLALIAMVRFLAPNLYRTARRTRADR